MKCRLYVSFFFLFTLVVSITANAQQFNGNWICNYATYDDAPNTDNSTGINTVDVGVIKENTFVALTYTTSGATNFLVGYTNADSAKGRMGVYAYGGGWRQHWMSGFDDVEMMGAVSLAATPDSLIYVANNDPARNILVFKLGADSVYSSDYRISTGSDSIWAVAVDKNGLVYVTTVIDSQTAGQLLIFNSIAKDDNWMGLHTPTPLAKITLPEPGSYRGIAVNGDGSIIYVSNFNSHKIYCYTGNVTNGYTLYNGFNFELKDTLVIDSVTSYIPGPIGLGLMPDKNILFVACHFDFLRGLRYNYGRIYALNPNTGDFVDTIDVAKWNYDNTGSYSNRPDSVRGFVSAYTSPYHVAFDEKYNVYDQSYFGWSADKWSFTGTLPTIPLTITSVEKLDNIVPNKFNLSQNYPNPFNPTTTIEFSLLKSSEITLTIYDITGQLVTTLINSSFFNSGNYKLTFDASKLASGTYIYVLNAGEQRLTKKMTLLK